MLCTQSDNIMVREAEKMGGEKRKREKNLGGILGK
jgi:hypothetical protein